MDKKSELMAQFYFQCKSNNYCDMSDPTQLLKAKVIASDLKLKYPADAKMCAFFSEAEKCFNDKQGQYPESDESIYSRAIALSTSDLVSEVQQSYDLLNSISDYKDARAKRNELKLRLDTMIQEGKEKQILKKEAAARKNKRILSITATIVAVCIAFIVALTTVIIPKQKLNEAMGLIDSGDYDSAYALLEEIGNTEAIAANKYDRAMALIDSGDYDSAYALLKKIWNAEAIAANKYDRAMALIASGDYESAYMLLDGLSYQDSEEKLLEIKPQYYQIKLSKAEVGSTVYFGTYEQDNNTSNGKEDIEWRVLAKDGSKLLIISEYALDRQPYNTKYTDVTWETCTLRQWMNGTFLNEAFNAAEQSMIQSATVSADKNMYHSTNPGNATTDKVFLLSITEKNKYFASDSARQCKPTKYAVANGAYVNSDNGNCWWWLRSPGKYQYYAAYADSFGGVFYFGKFVNYVFFCVRPALWINPDS